MNAINTHLFSLLPYTRVCVTMGSVCPIICQVVIAKLLCSMESLRAAATSTKLHFELEVL